MMWKTLAFLGLLAVCTAKYEITTISDHKTALGGAPHWDAKRSSLYYVDIFSLDFNIFRFDWNEQKVYKALVPINTILKVIDFIVPIAGSDDLFAIGDVSRVTKLIRWDGISKTAELVDSNVFSVEQESDYMLNAWHIAKADPAGRFVGGSTRSQFCNDAPPTNSSLYKYTKEDGVQRLLDGFKVTGGMDWDTKSNTFYIVDICENIISAYDWCPQTGDICNGREILKTYEGKKKAQYFPVSVAVAQDGMIFASMYNNGSIWKIDPNTSEVVEIIEMPTEITVNVVFGGPDLDVLFVTSAELPFDLNNGAAAVRTLTPEAGSLFIVKGIGAKGYDGRQLSEL